MNEQTILSLNASYPNNTGLYPTAIQYMSIGMNNGSSNYGGYAGGGSVYSTGNSFLSLGTNVSEVKEKHSDSCMMSLRV